VSFLPLTCTHAANVLEASFGLLLLFDDDAGGISEQDEEKFYKWQ
jgi:hypothetical protein